MHYYKSGTGSGGMVNVTHVTNIPEGLQSCGIPLNERLLNAYRKWEKDHPYDLGNGWGGEPWSQEEMPLPETLVQETAQSCETALVIIGRTAGEEQDNRPVPGSYMLTETEEDMLLTVRKHFRKMIVLLNTGNIMDMSFMERCTPDALLYVWQGGMTGGTGTAWVLTGKCSPSGKLPDTIAYSVTDYPSDTCFGDADQNCYREDIYVGYRYFETFAPEKVRYPFGFGMSYTSFSLSVCSSAETENGMCIVVSVRNTGSVPGKETVQVYAEPPQGKLGKPVRVLCAFEKTRELKPDEEEKLTLHIPFSALASYDDSGVTGHRFCELLESGTYRFHVGTDVRSAAPAAELSLTEDKILAQHRQALAPVQQFSRIRPTETENGFTVGTEDVPCLAVSETQRRSETQPPELAYTGDRGIRLADVQQGRSDMDSFIAQLPDEALACIIRGEGMGSPRVTPGTASAFGGVSDTLTAFGIPCGCCSDGPSGMRLDCGTKAFSLPGGTLLAATFNRPLMTALFTFMGLEMTINQVDCLLGPGMNIHRHPLNGRNFEYFSEDPLLTGKMAAAQLQGLHSAGVSGTVKHFCANNQETRRHFLDSVVSERALREIYLKGFEIAVREGGADSVMTTYGAVNGIWTAGSYDLCTEILRREWGFTGFVMTDWWANINRRGKAPDKTDLAAMAMAQNDVYMVCADSTDHEDNILSALADGTLERGELQRNAANICRFLLHTNAMKRMMGEADTVEVLHRPEEETQNGEAVVFYDVDKDFTLPLTEIPTERGSSYSFALRLKHPGHYRVTLTASSVQGELAQIPVTLFSMGTANGTFTWNGTGGKPVSFEKELRLFSRFTTMRLYFAQSGLQMQSIRFELTGEGVDVATLSQQE
jgi:beta-glucosidase